MKIGILTVYFADYGSFFHTYSLYHYLLDKGYDCEIINACGRLKYSPRLNLAMKGTQYLPKFVLDFVAKRKDVFRTFLNLQEDVSKLTISEKYDDISEISKKYDCIIVGSDELWSATNPTIRFIPEYFGLNLCCPVFSYSTSGVTLNNPSNEMLANMKKGLSSFTDIAVRDSVTAEWVGRLLEKKIDVVLDPTLLYPCFAGKEKYDSNYILVYGEDFSEQQISKIREFSKKKGWLLKSVVWKHEWCDEYLDSLTAEELQNYFKSACYCLTSTFHGTIFSIVNKKNFTSFISEARGLKVELLLKQLNLQNRICGKDNIEIVDTDINYCEIDNLLAEQRLFSEKYLEKAIQKIEKKV